MSHRDLFVSACLVVALMALAAALQTGLWAYVFIGAGLWGVALLEFK